MDEDVKQFFENLSVGSEPDIRLANVKTDVAAKAVMPHRVRSSAKAKESHTVKEEVGAAETEATAEPESVFDEEDFGEGEGQLTVDVYQTPDEIVVQSTIAGVDPDYLEVSINNEMVTVRGQRQKREEVETKDYFVQELYWGKFSRSVILPQEIDSEKALAELKNGVLTVRLPKIKKQKTKRLKIKSA